MVGKGDYEYFLPFYGGRRPILIDLVSLPDETLRKEGYSVIRKEGNILIAETPLPRPLGRASVLLGKASRLFNEEGEVIGAIESAPVRGTVPDSPEPYRLRHDHH